MKTMLNYLDTMPLGELLTFLLGGMLLFLLATACLDYLSNQKDKP